MCTGISCRASKKASQVCLVVTMVWVQMAAAMPAAPPPAVAAPGPATPRSIRPHSSTHVYMPAITVSRPGAVGTSDAQPAPSGQEPGELDPPITRLAVPLGMFTGYLLSWQACAENRPVWRPGHHASGILRPRRRPCDSV